MVNEMPVDSEKEIRKLMTKFEALGNITRATWFEWREAAIATARPEFTPMDLVLKAWEVVGHDTAKAYFPVLDVSSDTYIKDIAQAIVNSSTMMGEDAKLVPGENENEIYVQWDRCPWPEFARTRSTCNGTDAHGPSSPDATVLPWKRMFRAATCGSRRWLRTSTSFLTPM
jgi:hypothetical protein